MKAARLYHSLILIGFLLIGIGCNVERFENRMSTPREDGKVITLGENDRRKPLRHNHFGSTRGGFGTTGSSGFGSGFGTTGGGFSDSGFGQTNPN